MFEDIKSISAFSSAYDLIEYVSGKDAISETLNDDGIEFLQSLNDYESFTFFIINDKFVIISDFSGNVSGSVMSYDEFLTQTFLYVEENA